MDNKCSAKFKEQIETEMKMQNKWLKEMDLSDAKPLPPSVTYASSSIAQLPFDQKNVVPSDGFKPVPNRQNMERAKSTYGFVYQSLDEVNSRSDPRPRAQVFRNTGVAERHEYVQPPQALRCSEYYGRTHKCHDDFYRGSGAFRSIEEK